MTLRSPRSPLFPYTTLFRSRSSPIAPGPWIGRTREPARETRLPAREARGRHGDEREAADQDRKSTRLNSSHANISYAVFCLKKKTNKNMYPGENPNLLH